MYDPRQDLLAILQAGPALLTGLLQDCTQEQAQSARDGEEGWSILEIVCHLRDAEERGLERLRLMRDQDDPLLEAYDQESWVEERRYADDDLQEALAAFLAFRSDYVSDLTALPPEAWARTGRHEEIGSIDILSHTLHHASHDAIHAAQIARTLGLAE
jgi:uncharacterized damage-inducible protein DinB